MVDKDKPTSQTPRTPPRRDDTNIQKPPTQPVKDAPGPRRDTTTNPDTLRA